jgi:hypothetical protein
MAEYKILNVNGQCTILGFPEEIKEVINLYSR